MNQGAAKVNARVAVCSRSFSAHPLLRAELEAGYTHVTFNDSGKTLAGAELVKFLQGHDRAIVALEAIDAAILRELPELKVIGKYGVGLDKLDFAAMDYAGVSLGWTPGVNAQGVAELTLGLALNIVRNIHVSNALVTVGGWRQVTGRQLSSMTFAVLGCGHVGKKVARLARSFGCRVLACDIKPFTEFYRDHNIEHVCFERLIREADILSLHIPKNETTENIISRAVLEKMQAGSYLINTARGGLVDELALGELLDSGHIAAAALDVFAEEPPRNTRVHPHLFATSHIGGSSEEAILAMGRAAIAGLSTSKKASEYER